MFFDLKGDASMSPIVGMLYSAVKENSERLKLITDGMSQEEVDYKGPNTNYNSTAQLMRHVMYVDLNWIYRIKGQSLPNALRDQYGPLIDVNNKLPMIKGTAWDTLISQYETVIVMLEETCQQLHDSDLDNVVRFGHENEKQATIRWGLWHMADHSRYHQAHINQLRRWYKQNLTTE
ncbi:uncharacterized protein DUF664 [Paenibacillus cellulosilyticus]|uniref:Uncharacterized protein DUF664 n=1 Tax=Paenibacillus cellulosilyticus TaxID=375489 RepID=A0A2V2YUB1_9BACL|nr:DinB family protein [Paenibacillus cellulosilyticus]PWW00785.1 uncharacterized protein DUF664 [Paenibacillus cellulosilyticus]QKS45638.1 DinB family protein [Paenibacillus cellulosilyticus]